MLKDNFKNIFSSDYPGYNRIAAEIITPIFKNDFDYLPQPELLEIGNAAEASKIMSIKRIGIVNDGNNIGRDTIEVFDITVSDSVKLDRSRVNIQRWIRSELSYYSHALLIFHYENPDGKDWRISYLYKPSTLTRATEPKRFTYLIGKGFSVRTITERFTKLTTSIPNDEALLDAFSVQALSDDFFNEYRKIYADFVQYVTGKRSVKTKGKWEEKLISAPNEPILEEFNHDEKRIRDYIKKMMGRLTFLYFLQRKGWLNNDYDYLNNLYKKSEQKADFLDCVLEPLFFGILNTPLEKREAVFNKNGWNADLLKEWEAIPYLNGGLFEQNKDDRCRVKFPQSYFDELFSFFSHYNFTIDENDPYDSEIGIDPEMLGRVFESLLEDNKDKGAFYTPKEIVQYMCRRSISQYLKSKTQKPLHQDIETLINSGFVNQSLQNRDNAQKVYQLLCDVKVCDPAIGSGAFPMGILDILYATRRHLYGFLGVSAPFNPVEVKKSIIKENIFGIDIEQGAVDIARLRFWLAILVEEVEPSPLPNLDYRIVRGDSLLTTFNNEYIDLSYTTDKRTKLMKLKSELFRLEEKLYSLRSDEKFECEIDIKNKILEIVKYQLGIDKKKALEMSEDETHIFEEKKISKAQQKEKEKAKVTVSIKKRSLTAIDSLINKLFSDKKTLIERAQTDINFFDWEIIFSEIFNNDGFDIVIGNPPYGVSITGTKRDNVVALHGKVPDYEIYYYFIEVAARLLKTEGIMSYIIPNTYLFNTYAANYRSALLDKWTIHEILDCTKFPIFHSAVVRNTINLWQLSTAHNRIGYRNTSGVNTFDELLSRNIEFMSKDNLLKLNQNWGLAFSLSDEIINLTYKITNSGLKIINDFEVSQGYIPYRLSDLIKLYGTEKGKAICKNRLWHSFTKESTEYLQEIYGRDITKYDYKVQGEYVKYGKHLACYVDLKFFSNNRLVVREITNPQIIACKLKSTEILVHDPQLIAIIPNKETSSLNILWAILNSKLATFYHFNHSPKATKGAFPKILIQDIKDFPLPHINDNDKKRLEALVNEIHRLKNENADSDTLSLENEIDFIVYKLYGLDYNEVLLIDNQPPFTQQQYEQ